MPNRPTVHTLLLATLIGLVLVGILQIIGDHYFLYWQLAWYDILMHFLGGVVIGLATLTITRHHLPQASGWQLFSITLIAVLIVGIGWEVFEAVANIQATFGVQHLPDTLLDLAMDALGAFTVLAAYYQFFFIPFHERTSTE